MNLTTSGTHNLTTLGIYANNIEKIYQKLARPFQDLENEAGSVDEP